LATIKKRLEEGHSGAVEDIPAPPRGGRLIVVGDTHGQLQDFLWILHEQGLPSPQSNTFYLINGDIADRGEKACEIYLLVFALKLVYPKHIYFTRGNHETDGMNTHHGCGGFQEEVVRKYTGEKKNQHDKTIN
jgi:protein phosphatase